MLMTKYLKIAALGAVSLVVVACHNEGGIQYDGGGRSYSDRDGGRSYNGSGGGRSYNGRGGGRSYNGSGGGRSYNGTGGGRSYNDRSEAPTTERFETGSRGSGTTTMALIENSTPGGNSFS